MRSRIFPVLMLVFSFLFFSSAFALVSVGTHWAKSVTTGSDNSPFFSIAKDANGNVYAVGYIDGSGAYDFGNGITISGVSSIRNIILVKYDNNGNAQWAKGVTTAPSASLYRSVTVDSNGNIYATGYIYGTGTFGFGNGITASGTAGVNIVLVKYDSNGNTLWARSGGGPNNSSFISVAVDSNGNIYAAGYIGTGTFSFGNGITATGTAGHDNPVLVKYDSNGNALWAKSITAGTNYSYYVSTILDSSGNIYAAGYMYANGSYGFGNGVTIAGASSGYNPILVKYDSNGNAQWAKSIIAGSNNAYYYSITLDPTSGSIYAAGTIAGTGNYGFGNGVTVAGTVSDSNSVLVKYNSSGNAMWAKSIVSGLDQSQFNSVKVDSSENVYVAGTIVGSGTYGFGNSVTAAGVYSSGQNIVLVKYDNSGNAQWAKSIIAGSNASCFNSLTLDGNGNIYATGYMTGSTSYDFGNSVTITGAASVQNGLLVKYGYIPPTLTDINKSTYENINVNFTVSDFTSSYNSPLNNSLDKIQALSLPTNGALKLSGSNVTVDQEISSDNLGNLIYIPNIGYIGNDSFSWNGGDGVLYAVSPANVNMVINAPTLTTTTTETSTTTPSTTPTLTTTETPTTTPSTTPTPTTTETLTTTPSTTSMPTTTETPTITVTPIPPTTDDITKLAYKNTLVTFTPSDFTNKFHGYLNGNLTRITITRLPNAGKLKISGVDVDINDEIAVEDLENLVYKPDSNWTGQDGFSWKGSDGILYSLNPADVVITIKSPKASVDQNVIIGTVTGTVAGIGIGATATCATYWCYKHHHDLFHKAKSGTTKDDGLKINVDVGEKK